MLKIIAAGVLATVVIASCLRKTPLEKYRESNVLGGTVVTIDVCVERGRDSKKTARALDDVWGRLNDIYHRMSNFVAGSDMAKINRSFRNPQKVGADTVKVYRQAEQYNKLTRGAFDVTVGPLMDLWKKCQMENRMPTAAELQEAKKAVGMGKVTIHSGNTVEITDKNTRVDYGGIAAGYAVDEAVRILRQRGFKNFLIDIGGDMYAAGVNCSRKPWTIAIKDPQDKDKILDIIEVSNASVSTSGDYEQFYEIRGQRFSRIINPSTGYPQQGVISATVIAPTGLDNEAFAKALCVLEPKRGMDLIDKQGRRFAGIAIHRNPEGRLTVYKSANYKNFQIKKSK